MDNVTRLRLAPREGLTSGHRCLLGKIQDLCIDVSLHSPTHVAECQYFGHTHELSVRAIPRYNLGGSWAAEWTEHLYLPGGEPPSPLPCSLRRLGEVLERLQALLPSPGGAA